MNGIYPLECNSKNGARSVLSSVYFGFQLNSSLVLVLRDAPYDRGLSIRAITRIGPLHFGQISC